MPLDEKSPADKVNAKATKEPTDLEAQRLEILECLQEYLMESRANAKEWQDKAQRSWDMIHGRIDWSHKENYQSKVHINRVGLAQEQIKAQIKAGLVNFDKWLTVEAEPGFIDEDNLFPPDVAQRMVLRGIRRTDPKAKLTDNIGTATVENILATKLKPILVKKPGKAKPELHIEHVPLNIRNYYPDANQTGLYEFHEVNIDHYELLKMAADDPTTDKPFRMEAVKNLEASKPRIEQTNEDEDKGNDRTRIQNQRRRQHVLHEFWGTVLTSEGEIMEWKAPGKPAMKLENVVITIANEHTIIGDPRPFPCWDGCSDIIHMQLLRSNINTYGRSLLAPGVDMNRAEDELVNAGIDAAKKEAYNVNILHVAGLAEPEQVSDGVREGSTLLQNSNLPPGTSVLETANTGKVPNGLLPILQIVRSAGAENMRLNEVAISGNLPTKQVRATELVASNQTIQGLFESIVQDVEDVYMERYAKKIFNMMLQHSKMLTEEDLSYIFYGNEQRIDTFKGLSSAEIKKRYGHSFRFRGKGIRTIAANARQGQALIQVFTAAASNPLVLDSFERSGLPPAVLFEKFLRSNNIDVEELRDPKAAEFAQARQLVREQALAQAEIQGQGQQQAPGTVQPANGPSESETEPGNGAGSV